MQDSKESIVHLFPDFKERIDHLFRTDENFRDLCADYILCARTLMNLKRTKDNHTDDLTEYNDLKQSLEEEILHFLNKN
jgi:DNA-directed RNA polymerase subunit N (RpoN/RPB10)